jgi:lysophospholipase L1-like esterase
MMATPAFVRRSTRQIALFAVAATALSFLLPLSSSHADTGAHYYIDFGAAATPTTAVGWNNINGTQAKDTTSTFALVDSTGAASGMTLHFTDGFNCLPNGTPTNSTGTTASTVYPATATEDGIFIGASAGGVCTQTDATAAFRLGGLSSNATYDVRFYASRLGDNGTNRTADYSIGATTVSLNASGNVNGVVTIPAVTPTSGTITATITKPSNSIYAYLGVVEIIKHVGATSSPTPTPTTTSPPTTTAPAPTTSAAPPTTTTPAPTTSAAPTSTTPTTPAPAKPVVSVNASPDQAITLPAHQVTLNGSANESGGTIASYSWSELTNGGATILSPTSATTTVTDLAEGNYTFRLTATDSSGVTGTDDVTVVVNPQNVTGCPAKKIVVMGSSTAEGQGALPISDSWANLYTSYLQQIDPGTSVVNIAVNGHTTYNEMPDGFVSSIPDRGTIDETANITAAVNLAPDAIILSLPSNDIATFYSVAEVESNFQVIMATAAAANIPIWITTTQPRSLTAAGRADQMTLRDWITTTYGQRALDFWSVVANPDGNINPMYSFGDGIHVNNLGHQKFYNRVAASNIMTTLCTPAPVISGMDSATVISQSITWITDTAASSEVEYGTTTSYGTTTPEADTSPRVTNHSVLLPNLSACTNYHYRVHSLDANETAQVSGDTTFMTPCATTSSAESAKVLAAQR